MINIVVYLYLKWGNVHIIIIVDQYIAKMEHPILPYMGLLHVFWSMMSVRSF